MLTESQSIESCQSIQYLTVGYKFKGINKISRQIRLQVMNYLNYRG